MIGKGLGQDWDRVGTGMNWIGPDGDMIGTGFGQDWDQIGT